jgi:hypothetical protein
MRRWLDLANESVGLHVHPASTVCGIAFSTNEASYVAIFLFPETVSHAHERGMIGWLFRKMDRIAEGLRWGGGIRVSGCGGASATSAIPI